MRGIHASTLNFDDVRAEFEVPGAFPEAVEREAAAARDAFADDRVDARDIPFVSIDPPGSRDIDQALHVEKAEHGFRLRYAIADVGAFVHPGSALHDEAMRRGQTVYLPDGNVPLHPRTLSEDRASLLEGADRPCVLWTIDTDAAANVTSFTVARASIRNRAQLDYATVQGMVDAGDELPEALRALPEFGALRQQTAQGRGAIELQLPAQELTDDGNGGWQLRLEPRTTVDEWNAECSLLTGQCAAQLMIEGGVGVLRTLPAPDAATLHEFRSVAAGLGVEWPADVAPGAFLASLPRADVRTLALMSAATRLLRGSGYVAFAGDMGDVPRGDVTPGVVSPAEEPPADAPPSDAPLAAVPPADERWHAGVAAEYAHATAPLRRLADRFSSEICLALAAKRAVPAGVLEALAEVPARMNETSGRANSVSNSCLNKAEAVAMQAHLGKLFDAAVLRPGGERRAAEVFVLDPPVLADCVGGPPLGEPIRVRCTVADPAARSVVFDYQAGGGTAATGPAS